MDLIAVCFLTTKTELRLKKLDNKVRELDEEYFCLNVELNVISIKMVLQTALTQ